MILDELNQDIKSIIKTQEIGRNFKKLWKLNNNIKNSLKNKKDYVIISFSY